MIYVYSTTIGKEPIVGPKQIILQTHVALPSSIFLAVILLGVMSLVCLEAGVIGKQIYD